MRKFILPLIGLLICLLSVTFFVIKIYPRYYFLNGSRTGTSIAEEIIRKKRDVKDCFRIIDIDPFPSPSAEEQSELCVYSYAELTKDPSACELLMPSDYGWNCLGAAMDFDPCVFLADAQKTVKGEGIVTTYNECIQGPASTKNHVCCIMARITFQENNIEQCNIFADSDALSDQCHNEVAIKKSSLEECSLMKNPRNRTGCEVGVRALIRNNN